MLPDRKSPRAAWLPYTEGEYFVTICTHDKLPFFGQISDEIMHLSPVGTIADEELRSPAPHHPHIEVPVYVVMPNHIHMIVIVRTPEDRGPDGRHTMLSNYIGSMKSAVTKRARDLFPDFGWQRSFHDHKIRNAREANLIANYIETNVLRWVYDRYHN